MTTKTMADITESNEQFQRLAKFSGIPINTFMSHRIMNFVPVKGTEEAKQSAVDFVGKRQHHFLTLRGEPGRGKSHLALGIAWSWLEYDMGVVKYWQVEQLLDAMKREYSQPLVNNQGILLLTQFEHTQKASLLILDDIGAEKSTEWAGAKLDELVDYRYINELPTVFTTNLLFSQLAPRIASRLQEGVTVLLEGYDYRKIKAKMRSE